jgi:hypothetical protein
MQMQGAENLRKVRTKRIAGQRSKSKAVGNLIRFTLILICIVIHYIFCLAPESATFS